VWEQVCDVKQNHLRSEARQRFFEQQKKALLDEPEENKALSHHLQTQVELEGMPFSGAREP
ncbi:MAG: hypothetical protein LBH93_01435, partial [Chitinispirillales bacterium]|jgi:hypothetical protein|nr:hypothetical protein [Chitinispirillales bacterium]